MQLNFMIITVMLERKPENKIANLNGIQTCDLWRPVKCCSQLSYQANWKAAVQDEE